MQAVGSSDGSSGSTNSPANIAVDAGTNNPIGNLGGPAVYGTSDNIVPGHFPPLA